jgi:hypothetical protein
MVVNLRQAKAVVVFVGVRPLPSILASFAPKLLGQFPSQLLTGCCFNWNHPINIPFDILIEGADGPCWNTSHYHAGGNIFRDNASGTHNAVVPNVDPWHHNGVIANETVIIDPYRAKPVAPLRRAGQRLSEQTARSIMRQQDDPRCECHIVANLDEPRLGAKIFYRRDNVTVAAYLYTNMAEVFCFIATVPKHSYQDGLDFPLKKGRDHGYHRDCLVMLMSGWNDEVVR